ncbi:DUF7427 family protein [Mycolicibacterium llatzerense]|uniref:DUF7427 family protein n=1 Tax=Mycolicibacterium llatzerense TaxID=280871 RepID=UPI0021B6E487|nr:hypothetical protein [Mycolicibacterium llatzerense]MCT7369479.1 hypothetical protein [Mycolicibacterium llatzerense]
MKRADRGWFVIAAFVVGHNVRAAGRGDEMLSQAVDRYLERRPFLTWLVVGAVSLHLLNRLPPFADPLGAAMGTLARKIGPLS